jgi:alpha-amylase
MTRINLCFEVHQPLRLKAHFNPDVKSDGLIDHYFDMKKNEDIFNKVAHKCYLPANAAVLHAIDNLGKKFRVTYSISGVFLDQCEMFNPDVLESFKQLADTGCVEFLGQTYYHSLASLWGNDREEFVRQVEMHRERIKDLFGQRPIVFENTELIYNNMVAKTVAGLGFRGIFAEGCDHLLDGWKSPNYLYTPPGHIENSIKIFLRNYKLSDDIGYRFSARWWEEWPLTAEKYAAWLASTPGEVINIFIDYETFGEHHWKDTGILWFLGSLPFEISKRKNLKFTTPRRCLTLPARGELDVFEYDTISWADMERDTSAWLGNRMQQHAYEEIKALKHWVDVSNNEEMKKVWRYLQNSDHLYYLCTKGWGDGDVHTYFSPFGTAEDGFYTIHRIVSDIKWKITNRIS